jgi:nucleotide-binding universal stress UspA family protein
MALITRILVPTDFSEYAHRALEYAAAMSDRFDAAVVLVHIYASPVIPVPDGYVIVSPTDLVDMRARLTDGLDKEKARALAMGARRIETGLIDGTPWEQIVKAATDRACDLIVMGTHGRSGLSHLIIGSVAEKVVRKAACAVLTVGPRAQRQPVTPISS